MTAPMTAPKITRLKIFADGADLASMVELSKDPLIRGFTTNPTLMRKDGVADYKDFSKKILAEIKDKPISFEVFADDLAEMKRQAFEISSWARNVHVKIPITNTEGVSCIELIHDLSRCGVALNVTAVFTLSKSLRLRRRS